MLSQVRQRYLHHLEQIEQIMREQVISRRWDGVPQLETLVYRYLSREGKRLRPLLALIFADIHGGRLERVYHAAAAIEIYHTATLIYDDIQDNSQFRRGLPAAHVTASTSTAMNLGGAIRTLMYHPIHQATELDATEKLYIHQQLDRATTQVTLGQSIDIGWHEGWYPSYREFPYLPMIAGKTATLFECAAVLGAYLAHASPAALEGSAQLGMAIGVLFQQVDDVLDVVGDPKILGRPRYQDFREGKITAPILCLLDQLTARGQDDQVQYVLARLDERNADATEWEWLRALMDECNVEDEVLRTLQQQVATLVAAIDQQSGDLEARAMLRLFVESILVHIPRKADS